MYNRMKAPLRMVAQNDTHHLTDPTNVVLCLLNCCHNENLQFIQLISTALKIYYYDGHVFLMYTKHTL